MNDSDVHMDDDVLFENTEGFEAIDRFIKEVKEYLDECIEFRVGFDSNVICGLYQSEFDAVYIVFAESGRVELFEKMFSSRVRVIDRGRITTFNALFQLWVENTKVIINEAGVLLRRLCVKLFADFRGEVPVTELAKRYQHDFDIIRDSDVEEITYIYVYGVLQSVVKTDEENYSFSDVHVGEIVKSWFDMNKQKCEAEYAAVGLMSELIGSIITDVSTEANLSDIDISSVVRQFQQPLQFLLDVYLCIHADVGDFSDFFKTYVTSSRSGESRDIDLVKFLCDVLSAYMLDYNNQPTGEETETDALMLELRRAAMEDECDIEVDEHTVVLMTKLIQLVFSYVKRDSYRIDDVARISITLYDIVLQNFLTGCRDSTHRQFRLAFLAIVDSMDVEQRIKRSLGGMLVYFMDDGLSGKYRLGSRSDEKGEFEGLVHDIVNVLSHMVPQVYSSLGRIFSGRFMDQARRRNQIYRTPYGDLRTYFVCCVNKYAVCSEENKLMIMNLLNEWENEFIELQ